MPVDKQKKGEDERRLDEFGTVKEEQKYRFPAETELIKKAVSGDREAAIQILHYLCSNNKNLRFMMEAAIHDFHDARIWRYLISGFGLERWQDSFEIIEKAAQGDKDDELPLEWGSEDWCKLAKQSIADVFIIDESKEERQIKETLLHYIFGQLDNGREEIRALRYAAAYFLGMRGDRKAVPVLDEMVESGDLFWVELAIQALKALHSEESAYSLIKALILTLEAGQRELHRLATSALNELGPLAEQAWMEALEHDNSHIRWHAVRGLSRTGNFDKLEILAEGLHDDSHAVRWATANALADIGQDAVPAILKVLTTHPINEPFRQAAYHALHAMRSEELQKKLQPILEALHTLGADVEAPMVAERMLEEWERESVQEA